MMHAIGDSSDGFFWLRDEYSTGFYIVDKGYDVWVANSRGNKYSLSHVNPKITKQEFFDFSWEEMGRIDLPAFYNYILKTTNSEKIMYIGYCQGTTQMFVGLLDDESRKFLSEKTEKFIAISPVVFMDNFGYKSIKVLSKFRTVIYSAAWVFGLVDLFPGKCQGNSSWNKISEWICRYLGFACNGFSKELLSPKGRAFEMHEELASSFDDAFPSGTTAKIAMHYGQNMNAGTPKTFQKYDYGLANLWKYGSLFAPHWDLSVMDADIVLIAGDDDHFGTLKDAENLASELDPKRTVLYSLEGWDHFSFAYPSDTIKTEIFHAILDKELL